jgi:ABC-2 type transport system permease protein
MAALDHSLLRRWIAARFVLMLRNPRVTFFTFAFPVMFLLIFGGLNAGAQVAAAGPAGGDVPFAQFYTPAIGVFGLTLACYSNVIFGLATARDEGLLKRVRGTPLPMPIYLVAWLTGAALIGILSVVVMFAIAIPLFGVDLYPHLLPAAAVTLVLSAASLAAVGLAVATLVRNADQAGPVAQLTMLPVSFISGIFWPLNGAPDAVVAIAHVFPLYYVADAFGACFVPQTTGGGWQLGHLAMIALWGVAGLVVASRRFHAERAPGELVPAFAATRGRRRPPITA